MWMKAYKPNRLTDGLLVIRHLFGFSGDSLTSGAVSGEASRDASEAIASYLTDADSQLDIDGDGESKPAYRRPVAYTLLVWVLW